MRERQAGWPEEDANWGAANAGFEPDCWLIIQLTVAPGKDANGNDLLFLDADVDENGQLLAHLADLFKHRFTGGTHPFDIHEYLVLSNSSRPLGYDLV